MNVSEIKQYLEEKKETLVDVLSKFVDNWSLEKTIFAGLFVIAVAVIMVAIFS